MEDDFWDEEVWEDDWHEEDDDWVWVESDDFVEWVEEAYRETARMMDEIGLRD